MSDELEAGSTGESSGVETEGTQEAQGDQESAGDAGSATQQGGQQATPPSYFTADQAREMFQGFQTHYNNQLSTIMKQLMQRGATPAQAQNQVEKAKDALFPDDPKELNDWDVSHWMGAMKKMEAKFQKEIGDLRNGHESYVRKNEVESRSNVILGDLKSKVTAAISGLPAFKGVSVDDNSQKMRWLKLEIADQIKSRGINNVPISAIAKGINDYFQGEVDARYQEKMRGVAAPKPVGPSKGTGSSPGGARPKTMKDAHDVFAAMIKGNG